MPIRKTSVLILYNEREEILLQHRTKDAPRRPDHWGFFGGGVEAGETPEEALARELMEELEYPVTAPRLLVTQKYTSDGIEAVKYVFIEEYNSSPLVLHEGQGMGWFTLEATHKLLMGEPDRVVLANLPIL